MQHSMLRINGNCIVESIVALFSIAGNEYILVQWLKIDEIERQREEEPRWK